MVDKVSTPDSYKIYLATSNNPVSKSDYLKIVGEFFKFIMSLVFEGEHIRLPFTVGAILIRGVKVKPRINEDGEVKGLGPDWVKTKALWDRNPEAKTVRKIVWCLNEHTNGIRYKIVWEKKKTIMENQSLYSLIFSRNNKRTIHKRILEGKEYFIK